jgi:hypothetical protein
MYSPGVRGGGSQKEQEEIVGIRGDQLADQLDEANRELLAVIQAIPDDHWTSVCEADGRQCNVVAHHVAGANRAIADWVLTVVEGTAVPVTMDMVHARNAAQAQENANVAREDVVALLQDSSRYASSTLRNLSDEQLSKSAPVGLFGGNNASAGDLAEQILIGHVISHMNDLRSATATG